MLSRATVCIVASKRAFFQVEYASIAFQANLLEPLMPIVQLSLRLAQARRVHSEEVDRCCRRGARCRARRQHSTSMGLANGLAIPPAHVGKFRRLQASSWCVLELLPRRWRLSCPPSHTLCLPGG